MSQLRSGARRMIEVQVKTATGSGPRTSWPLGVKVQMPSLNDREWFVLVAVALDVTAPLRSFVIARLHPAAAAWISHMNWLTEPGTEEGKRNAGVDVARVKLPVFSDYEDRWDLLDQPTDDVPVLLPAELPRLRAGGAGGASSRPSVACWCAALETLTPHPDGDDP